MRSKTDVLPTYSVPITSIVGCTEESSNAKPNQRPECTLNRRMRNFLELQKR